MLGNGAVPGSVGELGPDDNLDMVLSGLPGGELPEMHLAAEEAALKVDIVRDTRCADCRAHAGTFNTVNLLKHRGVQPWSLHWPCSMPDTQPACLQCCLERKLFGCFPSSPFWPLAQRDSLGSKRSRGDFFRIGLQANVVMLMRVDEGGPGNSCIDLSTATPAELRAEVPHPPRSQVCFCTRPFMRGVLSWLKACH